MYTRFGEVKFEFPATAAVRSEHQGSHFLVPIIYFPALAFLCYNYSFLDLAHAAGPIIQPPNLGSTDRMPRAGFDPMTS